MFSVISQADILAHIGDTHKGSHQEDSGDQNDPPGLDNSAFWDRDIILPQEMISMGRPIPKKLRVASVPIAALTFVTIMNMVEEIKLGNRCFRSM